MGEKKGFIQGALFGVLVVLLAAVLAGCLPGLKKEGAEAALDKETQEKLDRLANLIDRNYLGEIDEESLRTGIYEGYLSGLDDPYSVYYDEENTKKLIESTSGEYEGIGTLLSQNRETGLITLGRVYEGSPAEKAGLKTGDILYKVAGKDVSGRELDDIVSEVKGEHGTDVEITVLRGETAEEITATVTREKIEYPTVQYRMLDESLGYLQILEFDSVTYKQYTEAFEALKAQGMKGMIVDLRNNPGGSLSIVCQILDSILPEGPIVHTRDKNGRQETIESDEEHQTDLPLTVLVNEHSASASEIFAGAIQDYGAGSIVGTQTYGKGVVQQLFDLGDGSCVKITISEYFTPEERSINGKGIRPDVEVAYKADAADPEADNQLDRAAEVLREACGQ